MVLNKQVKEREEELTEGTVVICIHPNPIRIDHGELGTVVKIRDEKFPSGEKKLKVDYENGGVIGERASHVEIYCTKPLCSECESKTVYHDSREKWICPFGHD